MDGWMDGIGGRPMLISEYTYSDTVLGRQDLMLARA